MNTKDRVPFYVNACHELGIEVLPPDVNESQIDFAVVEGKIRFGLNAVKSVGELAGARDHRGARGGRAVRVDLGLHRARRPAVVEQARARVARQVRRARLDRRLAAGDARRARAGARATARSSRPTGSPGRARSSTSATPPRRAAPRSTIRRSRRRVREARAAADGEGDARPLRLRAPAFAAARRSCARRPTRTIAELERRRDGESVTVGGIVGAVKQLTTKSGEPMVFMRLDDVTGGVEVRRLQLDLRRAPASCA